MNVFLFFIWFIKGEITVKFLIFGLENLIQELKSDKLVCFLMKKSMPYIF